jgi:hypothetical protein
MTAVLLDDFRVLRQYSRCIPDLRALLGDDALTWSRWLWASAAHSSRSFEDIQALTGSRLEPESFGRAVRGLGVMVPVLDMFNHDPENAHIQWTTSDPPAGPPRATIQKPVQHGDQILTHYGTDKTSEDLIIK